MHLRSTLARANTSISHKQPQPSPHTAHNSPQPLVTPRQTLLASHEHVILSTLFQQLQGILPQGYSLHGNLCITSPSMLSPAMKPPSPSLANAPVQTGTINSSMIPPPLPTLNRPPPVPPTTQYTTPTHANLSKTIKPMDPASLEILSLFTTALKTVNTFYYYTNQTSYITQSVTAPLDHFTLCNTLGGTGSQNFPLHLLWWCRYMCPRWWVVLLKPTQM